MVRAIALSTLLGHLIVMPYLPTVWPAERFLAQIRAEHQAHQSAWGPRAAAQILDRAVSWHAGLQRVAFSLWPLPGGPAQPGAPPAARELAMARGKLFDAGYFRGLQALLMLAAFRLSTGCQWWLATAILGAAVLVDSLALRRLRADEFNGHDPERYAMWGGLALAILAMASLALLMPASIPFTTWPAVPWLVLIFMGRSIVHFHVRGW
jgi:Domain of unknown function (DUF4400)